MKKIIVIILSLIFLAGLNFKTEAKAADLGKVGYVDFLYVFNEYQKTKIEEERLNKKGEAKEVERGKIVADLRRLQDELELSSDKEKEKKQEQIEEKIRQLQDFDRVSRIDLRKERDKIGREIQDEIKAVIQEYGQEEGYTIIFAEPALLYKTKELDLTGKIISILNERYNKKK